MKNINILLLLAFITLGLSSCKKEETPNPPTISDFELGFNDSGTAYVGSELHVETNIVAEAKIDRIQIEIHSEGTDKSMNSEWVFDTTYTNFSGLKNTLFHEHLDISPEADSGSYHFHFMVIDLDGNTKTLERELHLEIPLDTVAPQLSISQHPDDQQLFHHGETITISGTVSDDMAIGGLYVGLVRANQQLNDGDMTSLNTITLLHMHDFDGATSYQFTAQIVVGASTDNNPTPKDLTGDLDGGAAWQSGEYYLLVKSPDAYGGGVVYSERYLMTIEL